MDKNFVKAIFISTYLMSNYVKSFLDKMVSPSGLVHKLEIKESLVRHLFPITCHMIFFFFQQKTSSSLLSTSWNGFRSDSI